METGSGESPATAESHYQNRQQGTILCFNGKVLRHQENHQNGSRSHCCRFIVNFTPQNAIREPPITK